MSWKASKDLGPWQFKPQVAKPSYNEGDHIADYTNPRWQMGQGTDLPVTPTHRPCGYWTRGYTPPEPPAPDPPPLSPYLIGWYKFDEGTGTVVTNYATDGSGGGGLLPDMTVYNSSSNFWTYLEGFGSTPTNTSLAVKEYSRATFTSRELSEDFSMGIFFRKIPSPTWAVASAFVCRIGGLVLGNEKVCFVTQYATYGSKITNWRVQGIYALSASSTNYLIFTTNTWYFAFIPSDLRLRVVQADGTLAIGNSTIVSGGSDCDIIHAGVSTGDGASDGNYGHEGSYGDWIIYHGYKPTVDEWAVWYDSLRLRYSMPIRSGW